MAREQSELTNAQWERLAPLLPEPKVSPKGGRRPIANRPVFEGILWVLRSGARWKDLPKRYPSPSTCWRRLQAWEEQGVWLRVWRAFLGMLDHKQALDWEETFADGTFSPAKKGGAGVGKTKRGKGTKLMVVADGQGIPLGVHVTSASPHEVTLIETTLEQVAVPRPGRGRPRKNPKRLIYDMAADSDALRDRLAHRGIELICPYRRNRSKPKRHDGRKFRRYKRRWKIERSISWIGSFRRLLVRHEQKITMFLAFLHVACLIITLRQF